MISDIASIYNLKNHKEKLESLFGWGPKKVEKLLQGIEESKSRPFHKVLLGLGIPTVGEDTARILIRRFNNIDSIINASGTC